MQSILEADGIPVVTLHSERRLARPMAWLFSLARSVARLRRVFINFRPDIINVHLLGPELDTLLAARLAGTDNLVATIHSVYPMFCGKSWGDRIRRLRLRCVYAQFKAVIAVSDEVREWALCHRIVRPDRVFVVQNGIDPERVIDRKNRASLRAQHDIPPESFVFISVASLRWEKGHSVLLDAIARMPKEFRSASTLLLAGDGAERRKLEQRVLTLNIQENVRFLGVRHDVPALLALSDVFVVSSHREGLSMALLEAMATGLPVVSTKVAGSTLIVRDGVNGFIVPQNDAEAVSRALVYCIEHPEEIQRLGDAARSTVAEDFNAARMAELTEAVFAETVQWHARYAWRGYSYLANRETTKGDR
jgi:glycosyltransferase involved in cell wall biosynthesis